MALASTQVNLLGISAPYLLPVHSLHCVMSETGSKYPAGNWEVSQDTALRLAEDFRL